MLGRPDLSDRLPAITAPTLFATGRDHPQWTPQQADAASQLLPQGNAAVIDDAAYLLPLEQPSATIGLLESLWGEARTPA